jgi:2-methylcitrate dehydratase PrpD
MTHSERMVDFALSLKQQDIPSDVAALARLHTLDALGVGIAASSGSVQQRMAQSFLGGSLPSGACTVLGHGTPTQATSAALLNGSFIHALEYDDTHMASIVHGSSVLVPAVLAAAEQHQLNLGELTRLVTIGWEVLIRIGSAAPGAFQRRGFQVTSVGGALVSALLASLAAGASRSDMISAQGIAGSQASGIFEFLSEGATVKAMHPGWAAHAGTMAATLASAGMTGPSTVYEGRFGLYKTYTDELGAGEALGKELDTLGHQWMLRDAAFKLYPCCHYIHPFLEAVEALKAGSLNLDEIVRIDCKVPQGAAAIICEPWYQKQSPTILNEAKYSLPYCMGLAFLNIPITAQHFLSDQVNAEAVAFAQKVSWSPMPDADFPKKFQAEIEVLIGSGASLQKRIDQVKGSADRPASIADITHKFTNNTSPRYGNAHQLKIVDLLLHGSPDLPVSKLSDLLRAAQ